MDLKTRIATIDQSYSLEDSCRRRKFLNEMETLIQEIWAENNFCRIVELKSLAEMSRRLFEIVDSIQFTQDKLWFGGTMDDGSDHQSENSLPYVSICIILLASRVEDQSKFGNVMGLLSKHFNNHRSLLIQLMENDERLFYVLFSLMQLSREIELPEIVDPLLLGVHLLCEISFSETVFIDWLCSETIALAFSIQFFKTMRLKFSSINGIFDSINQALADDKTSKILVTNEQNDEKNDELKDDVARFTINELHGDQLVKNIYTIKQQVLMTLSHSITSTKSNRCYSPDDFTGFIVRFKSRLESLNSRDLLPFSANILLRILDELDILTD